MPPESFAAYGVIIFKSRASSFDIERHKLICEAYLSALPHFRELDQPVQNQMVTVWPINSDEVASEINQLRGTEICDRAIDHYGLPFAQGKLAELRAYTSVEGEYDTSSDGPFLVAWAPGTKITDKGAVALFVDMTDVYTYPQAIRLMGNWRDRIQEDPSVWRDGFQSESLVAVLRNFFDRYGAIVEIAN